MLLECYEVTFNTSEGDARQCLMDAQPLYKPGQSMAYDKIIGYAVMMLDSKGGNQRQLNFAHTDLQAVALFSAGLIAYCRDEAIRVISVNPVKVEWPTGETVRQAD